MNRPLRGIPIEQQSESTVVRMCLWAEARGDGVRGMLAVWWVLRNRALARVDSLKEEALRPRQFSAFNADDPNRPLLLTAFIVDTVGWAQADAVAALAESGDTVDPTRGATHYLNRAVCDVQPKWSLPENGWVTLAIIGHHEFGRAA